MTKRMGSQLIGFLIFFALLAQGLPAQAVPMAFTEAEKIYFNERAIFPLNTRICRDGECTIAGLKKNELVFSFDDGPFPRETQAVLKVLRKHRLKTTFFVHGVVAEKYEWVLDLIHRDGHIIANHGRSQSELIGKKNPQTVIDALMQTHEFVQRYLKPDDIPVYRNPGGYWRAARADYLNRHPILQKYVGPIFWNVGGDFQFANDGTLTNAADWRCQIEYNRGQSKAFPWKTKAELLQKCADGYARRIHINYQRGMGSLVLMHDNRGVTAKILDLLLTKLKNDSIDWRFLQVQDIPAVQQQFIEL